MAGLAVAAMSPVDSSIDARDTAWYYAVGIGTASTHCYSLPSSAGSTRHLDNRTISHQLLYRACPFAISFVLLCRRRRGEGTLPVLVKQFAGRTDCRPQRRPVLCDEYAYAAVGCLSASFLLIGSSAAYDGPARCGDQYRRRAGRSAASVLPAIRRRPRPMTGAARRDVPSAFVTRPLMQAISRSMPCPALLLWRSRSSGCACWRW